MRRTCARDSSHAPVSMNRRTTSTSGSAGTPARSRAPGSEATTQPSLEPGVVEAGPVAVAGQHQRRRARRRPGSPRTARRRRSARPGRGRRSRASSAVTDAIPSTANAAIDAGVGRSPASPTTRGMVGHAGPYRDLEDRRRRARRQRSVVRRRRAGRARHASASMQPGAFSAAARPAMGLFLAQGCHPGQRSGSGRGGARGRRCDAGLPQLARPAPRRWSPDGHRRSPGTRTRWPRRRSSAGRPAAGRPAASGGPATTTAPGGASRRAAATSRIGRVVRSTIAISYGPLSSASATAAA